MLGGVLAAFRPVLAVVLVGGVATAMVAPAADMAASQRAEARAASAGAAPLRNDPPPTHDPDATAKPHVDLEALVRACLESRDPDGDACVAAALESGMPFDAFRAKIAAKLAPAPTAKPEQSATPAKKPEPLPTTKPAIAANPFDALLKQCLETRDESSDACARAGEGSGLSAADWAAKIHAKMDAARQSDFAMWFEKCLGTRDSNSDDCRRAQELIGYGDADFQAKFERHLAERDAKSSARPAPKPTSASTFEVLLKACGETHDRNSDPCLRALILSGLQPAEFWARVELKFGAFH